MEWFDGFRFRLWLLVLILIAVVPVFLLGIIRKRKTKETLEDSMGYYFEKWLLFADPSYRK